MSEDKVRRPKRAQVATIDGRLEGSGVFDQASRWGGAIHWNRG